MSYYAQIVDVEGPLAVYDATHAELLRRTQGQLDGLVLHLCRATGTGFQVIEVWTDRAHAERAERDHVAPVLAEQLGTSPGVPDAPPHVEEFTVRGLVVPAGGIAV